MKRLTLVAVLAGLGLNCGPAGGASAAASQAQQQTGTALKGIAQNLAKSVWNGTVVIKDTLVSTTEQDDKVCCKSQGSSNMNQTVTITLTNGIAVAHISYDLRERSDSLDVYDYQTITGARTDVTTASGTNKDARVNVSIYPDGRFEIEYETRGVQGRYQMDETSQTTCKGRVGTDPNCKPGTTTNTDAAQPENLGGVSGSVGGKTTDPNKLGGTTSETTDSTTTSTGKRTVTWNLYRK